MKRLAMMLMSGMFAAASLRCAAQSACRDVAVRASVEAGQGELTLADLMGRDTCPHLREAAAQVRLGAVPRSGSVRVLDGRHIRFLIEELANHREQNVQGAAAMQIPARIVVKHAGATKSCAEIAQFVAGAAASQDLAKAPSRWREDLDCAAARGIPEDTPLELTRTTWSAASERWEFALRCARPEDCVPFLVWVHGRKTPGVGFATSQSGTSGRFTASEESPLPFRTEVNGAGRLVEPGQTAMLTWDQAGIRVVLPVTCLDAGALGQFVRVRFKNVARILRAKVVGEGTLRASL
jgi:hypothetical protein